MVEKLTENLATEHIIEYIYKLGDKIKAKRRKQAKWKEKVERNVSVK